MILDSLIGQNDPASPGAQIQPESPEAPAAGQLDLDQVAELPPVKQVLAGAPPAVWVPEDFSSPLTKILGANLPALGELGLSLYRSPNKRLILFNPQVIPSEQLQKLDAEGKLDSVAAPLEGLETPEAPTAPQAAPIAAGPVSGAPGLAPRAQSKLAGARLNSLMPKSPSQQAAPGAGKVLNSLLTRAI
jgi:hypothetical protein